MLLAEATDAPLSPRLLRKVFGETPDWATSSGALRPDAVAGWDVDWAVFQEGHPGAEGTAGEWLRRLVRALEPVVGQRSVG
ncbi:hypothetical protein [Streptomyces sp. 1222.5]|uniref:hypothetical protein n=1 Tax=Streptomyces sp. 1222.5 TaxID=1881026 RepID=UPI003D72C498